MKTSLIQIEAWPTLEKLGHGRTTLIDILEGNGHPTGIATHIEALKVLQQLKAMDCSQTWKSLDWAIQLLKEGPHNASTLDHDAIEHFALDEAELKAAGYRQQDIHVLNDMGVALAHDRPLTCEENMACSCP